jgi:hypothetical protein
MTDKERLKRWVHDALMRLGGRGTLLQVAKGWSATDLRKEGKMKPERESPTGIWELTDHGKRG